MGLQSMKASDPISPMRTPISDLDLVMLHQEVQSFKGQPPGKRLKCMYLDGEGDSSQIPGFGSFRALLDLLSERHPWSREDIAIPAALAVFAPPNCWTTEQMFEIRSAVAKIEVFVDASKPLIFRIAEATAKLSEADRFLADMDHHAAERMINAAQSILGAGGSLGSSRTVLDEACEALNKEDIKKATFLLRNARDALPKKPKAVDSDRAWEFAMAWLLGANGRRVNWDSNGWEGPMDAWGTLKVIVLDSVTLACRHLGGAIGGPNFLSSLNAALPGPRRGASAKAQTSWVPRGTRVPHFWDFVDERQYSAWTAQICEALTGKNRAECLCCRLHELYLSKPEAAKEAAVKEAREKGIPKVARLAEGNVKAKIRTHAAWHHITAWDGVYALFPFLMRAVRGGSKKIELDQIAASMLGYILREDLDLHEVPVAVKKCPSCGNKDVISLDLQKCDQCKKPFHPKIGIFSLPMPILLGPGGGFQPRDVRVCGDKDCRSIFVPGPVRKGESNNCPSCGQKASQRRIYAYFFRQPAAAGNHLGQLTPAQNLDPKDRFWIQDLVRILVARDPGVDFSSPPPPSHPHERRVHWYSRPTVIESRYRENLGGLARLAR
jgi:ribosomal protein L37AE/L43A